MLSLKGNLFMHSDQGIRRTIPMINLYMTITLYQYCVLVLYWFYSIFLPMHVWTTKRHTYGGNGWKKNKLIYGTWYLVYPRAENILWIFCNAVRCRSRREKQGPLSRPMFRMIRSCLRAKALRWGCVKRPILI